MQKRKNCKRFDPHIYINGIFKVCGKCICKKTKHKPAFFFFFTHIINMHQNIHDSVCYKLPQKHVSCVVALADMFFYHNEHCVLSL